VRILLDEGVPRVIQSRLPDLSISTVEELGWRGIKNGALLDLMTDRFQVLITTDKNIPYQQNLAKRNISAIILPTNEIPIVISLLPQIAELISRLTPGEVVPVT